jgi:hypothetical protein
MRHSDEPDGTCIHITTWCVRGTDNIIVAAQAAIRHQQRMERGRVPNRKAASKFRGISVRPLAACRAGRH